MLHKTQISRSSNPSRRQALVVGASGLCGMSLAQLLRAEAVASGPPAGKSVINIYLDGGPPQHDTIDPKPEAPYRTSAFFT